jgi:hypothetical protein
MTTDKPTDAMIEAGAKALCETQSLNPRVLASAAYTATAPAPIPMLLYCPNCGQQHIDEPDERTPDWTNPPHRSHLCHDCGCIWRPADVPTNGVGAIGTKGKADTWTTERGNAERAAPPSDSDTKGGEA